MATPVLMPVITEAGEDGVVTAWMVDEGSPVSTGTLIAEVQAEKVSQDVEAPADGVVSGLVPINQPVPQGEPICHIFGAKESAQAAAGQGPEEPVHTSPQPDPPPERVPASPAARRLAAELGIDLATIPGSGPGGRVTEGDVRDAAEGRSAAPAAPSGLRAVIARNMRESAQRTAAVTLTTRAVLPKRPQAITAAVIRIAAQGLLEHPYLNGTVEEDRFVPGHGVHVSVAIQTDAGLVAPTVRDADQKPIAEIAADVELLAERARAGALEAGDLRGGTFTVTNLGAYGVDAFTPIINPPQVAILGVGTIRPTPVARDDGSVEVRPVLTLSLTFDHAFVDGAPAAAFLATIRRLLEAG